MPTEELEGEFSLESLGELFESENTSDDSSESLEDIAEKINISEEEVEQASNKKPDDSENENEDGSEKNDESKSEDSEENLDELNSKDEDEDDSEKVSENETEETQVNSEFNKTKILIQSGLLEDVRIALKEGDEDGILLSEYEDITEDQLSTIIQLNQEKKKKDFEENYISKEGLSEEHFKIIDILKNGGDLKEVFQNPAEQIKRPFSDHDLTDANVQRQIVKNHYIHNLGHSQKEAEALIKQKEADFEIDLFANQIVNAYNKKYDEHLETISVNKAREAEEKRLKLVETKKALSTVLKDNKLKDNVSRKLISAVTEKGKSGKLILEEYFQSILENPSENFDAILRLVDKKSYDEYFKIKSSRSKTQSIISLVDALPKDKVKTKDTKQKETLTGLEAEINKIRIIN